MKILLAEDERITRRSLERTLEQWGHEVAAAEDGAAAWELYQESQFDIIVTDWDMPRIDGLELVRRIRAGNQIGYAYVIMLTGRSERLDLVAGMEAGADDFIAKPFDREELRVRLAAGQRIIDLERRLAIQNETLRATNERMRQDLRAAARVQQELLPSAPLRIGGLEFAWRYIPCDELGGDLLNVIPIGNAGASIYLADVSGHGVASSLMSVSVHRSLSVRRDRSSIILDDAGSRERERAAAPAQVATRLNSLYPMESSGGHFMTLVYAYIDSAALRLEYCAAGHPGPVLVRRGEVARSLETNGLPIGVMPTPEYSTSTVQLLEGDRLYLYSDGLQEAGALAGKLFGQRRVEDTIEESRDMPLQECLDAIIQAAVSWQGSDQFADDLSLLAFEVADV